MNCRIAEGMVNKYINHTLSVNDLEEFLEHIENCSSCYDELATYFIVHKAMEQLDEKQEDSVLDFRELLEGEAFEKAKSPLTFAVGKDISGKSILTDIGKMPHLLIAGATGSGKSVCINTLIMSILYKAAPEEVKLIMIDP